MLISRRTRSWLWRLLLMLEATSPALAWGQTPSTSWWLNQYSLLQGPSVVDFQVFQPDFAGRPDPSRPVALRNFTTLGMELGPAKDIAGTLAWAVLAGPQGGFLLRDPSIRAYDSQLIATENFQWHADARVHFGLGPESRLVDRLYGLQTFHAFTMGFERLSPFWAGLWFSARWNQYGPRGQGSVWEFYIAPNINWRTSDQLTLTLVTEENAGVWRDSLSNLGISSDPWYLEASLQWTVTPQLEITPSLNIPLAPEASLRSISAGFGISWTLL